MSDLAASPDCTCVCHRPGYTHCSHVVACCQPVEPVEPVERCGHDWWVEGPDA